MRDSSLIQLIKNLNEQDIKDLDKFLQSPYHNTKQTLLRLFRIIKKYYPEMSSNRLEKEYVYHKLYPKQPYDDRNLRKQMSYLKSAVEEFVKHQRLKENDLLQQRLLLSYYYRFEDYNAFSRRVNTWLIELQDRPLRDASYFLEMFWLHEILTYHPNNRLSQQFLSQEMLSSIVEKLDLFFLLSKLRLETDFNTWQRVVKKRIPSLIPFEKLKDIALEGTTDNILIDLFYRLYSFQEKIWIPDPKEFAEVFHLFQKNLKKMGTQELGFMFNTLTNICIAHVNKNKAFAELYTSLIQFGHEKDLILDKGQISPANFLNVAIISSGAGAFEWVEFFIDHYKIHLTERDRDLIVNLSRSSWYYHQANAPGISSERKKKLLEEALNEIIVVPYEGYVYDLRIRSLQIRIYFDLYLPENSEKKRKVFTDYARAFRKYLKERDPHYKESAEPYVKFIEYIKRIARIRISDKINTKKIEELSALNLEIKNDHQSALIPWLLKTVRELTNSLT